MVGRSHELLTRTLYHSMCFSSPFITLTFHVDVSGIKLLKTCNEQSQSIPDSSGQPCSQVLSSFLPLERESLGKRKVTRETLGKKSKGVKGL